jgi:hypothetical protein
LGIVTTSSSVIDSEDWGMAALIGLPAGNTHQARGDINSVNDNANATSRDKIRT